MLSLCKKIIVGGLSENIAHLKIRFLFWKSVAFFIYAAGFFIISLVLFLNGFFGPFALNEKYSNSWYRSIFCWVYLQDAYLYKPFTLALTDRLEGVEKEVVIGRRDKRYLITIIGNEYIPIVEKSNFGDIPDVSWKEQDISLINYSRRIFGSQEKNFNNYDNNYCCPAGILYPLDIRSLANLKQLLGNDYKYLQHFELSKDNSPWLMGSCLLFLVSVISFVKAFNFFKLYRNTVEETIIDETIVVVPPVRSHAIAGTIVATIGIWASWYLLIAPLQYALAAVFALSGLCLALSGVFAHVALYDGNIVICSQKEMLAIPCEKVKWLYTECCDGCTDTLCIGFKHRIIRTEIPGNEAGQKFYEKCIAACEDAAVGYKPSMMLSWDHAIDWSNIVSATRSELE
ncbi:MAG: hypothetical protein K6G50_07140 [bacterium]|nr:hypothetical protein [bacterium]